MESILYILQSTRRAQCKHTFRIHRKTRRLRSGAQQSHRRTQVNAAVCRPTETQRTGLTLLKAEHAYIPQPLYCCSRTPSESTHRAATMGFVELAGLSQPSRVFANAHIDLAATFCAPFFLQTIKNFHISVTKIKDISFFFDDWVVSLDVKSHQWTRMKDLEGMRSWKNLWEHCAPVSWECSYIPRLVNQPKNILWTDSVINETFQCLFRLVKSLEMYTKFEVLQGIVSYLLVSGAHVAICLHAEIWLVNIGTGSNLIAWLYTRT